MMSIEEFYNLVENEVVDTILQEVSNNSSYPTDSEIIDVMYDVLDYYLNMLNYADELLSYFNQIYSKQTLQSIYNNHNAYVNPESPLDMVNAIIDAKYIEKWEDSCVNAVNSAL